MGMYNEILKEIEDGKYVDGYLDLYSEFAAEDNDSGLYEDPELIHQINQQLITRIFEVLNKNPSITSLSIYLPTIDPVVIDAFCDGIKNNKTLLELQVRVGKPLSVDALLDGETDKLAAQVMSAIAAHKNLIELNVVGRLGKAGGAALATILTSSDSRLEYLNLVECCLTLDSEKQLAQALANNQNLHSLIIETLESNYPSFYEKNGGCAIVEALKINTSLTSVSFKDAIRKPAPITRLCQALSGNKRLRRFELSDASKSGMDDTLGKTLINTLQTISTLEILVLTYNNLRFKSALALANMLKTHHGLRELYIEENAFTSRGIYQIAKALKTNTNLSVLSIGKEDRNDANDDNFIIEMLADALENNKALTKFFLGEPGSYSMGAGDLHSIQTLTEALEKNTTLVEINFSNSEIIEEYLERNREIRERNREISAQTAATNTYMCSVRANKDNTLKYSFRPLIPHVLHFAGMEPSIDLNKFDQTKYFENITSCTEATDSNDDIMESKERLSP